MNTRITFTLDLKPVVAGTLALFLMFALLFPVFAQTKGSHKSKALSNVKQLGVALVIYFEDFDYHHPPAGTDIQEILYDYTKNPQLFFYNGFPVSYNERLAGSSEPGDKPRVAFFLPDAKLNGINISRTDSSARYLRYGDLKKETWEPYGEAEK